MQSWRVLGKDIFGGSLGVQLGGGGSGPSYDADAVTLFAAMEVQPDDTRKLLISNTIAALKSAGIWDELDEMWMMAAHHSQAALLGWKRYRDLTAVNAPTFEADRGYAGDGATSYLDTGYVPSADGINYQLNDASFGVYSRTNLTGNALFDIGAYGSGIANIAQIRALSAAGITDAWINQSGSNQVSSSPGTSTGLTVGRRTDSNETQIFRNGAVLGSNTTVSTSRTVYPLYICARCADGNPGGFTARQYAFAFVGGAMTTDQQSDLYDIVQDYLTAIGANV